MTRLNAAMRVTVHHAIRHILLPQPSIALETGIPFQPVALSPLSSGQVALERASLLAPDGAPGTPPTLPDPLGKILSPRALPSGEPYRVREEELPREGRRVSRVVRRSRAADGETYLWVSRRRGIGTGEGWSGLRYDAVEVAEPPIEE